MMSEKEPISRHELRKYLFWVIIIGLIVVSYFIIQPYIVPLISAFILAYLSRPVYLKLNKHMPDSAAATLCILMIFIIVLVPLAFIIGGIATQTAQFLTDENIENLAETLSEIEILERFDLNFENIAETSLDLIKDTLRTALTLLPIFIISAIIIMFGVYYTLLNWEVLASKLKQYLPFQHKDRVAKELAETTNKLMYGTVLIAIIEFIIALIGFYILGINAFILLSFAVFILAFIPGLGPALVWIPMVLYFFFIQNYPIALGVLTIGLILTWGIDIILRSKFLGNKANLNPLLMFIGILGGISLFGIFGFIIGPIILIYTLKIIEESIKEPKAD